MNNLTSKRFQLSNLNTEFCYANLPFHQYITKMQTVIAQARTDLDTADKEMIVTANSPREHLPPPKDTKYPCAIVLIHGFLDSPMIMSSLFDYYRNKGYLVRSLLLPGHGTRPGDLLDITSAAWLAASKYAIDSVKVQADKVVVLGFSMGACLAILQAFQDPKIDALVLFSPAIRIKRKLAYFSHWHKLISWAYKRAQWGVISQDDDYAKYHSFPVHAATQVARLSKSILSISNSKHLSIPQFIVISADDEIISPQAAINYFQLQPNPHNQLVLYSNQANSKLGPKVTVVPSAMPTKNILNYSHVCLPVAPDHSHYGEDGDFTDLLHYEVWHGKRYKKPTTKPPYSGAISLHNLRKYNLSRLSYNPQFYPLMEKIDKFLADII